MLLFSLLACASDPESVTLDLVLANVATEPIVASDASEHDVKLAPALVCVHDPEIAIFTPGEPLLWPEFEALAEDGNPQDVAEALANTEGVTFTGILAHQDEVTYEAAASLPGDSGHLLITAPRGSVVSIAFMFGESNDAFLANDVPIEPIVDHVANAGEWTASIGLWDAGTEVNEELGIGPNQAARQANPGDGEAENGVVTAIDGVDAQGFAFPATGDVLQLSADEVVLEE
jgi:hypothetical protein